MNVKRSNTQFERQVDIDRRIRAGEFPSVPELAAAWEVDARTIKRDVEFMRDRLPAPKKLKQLVAEKIREMSEYPE